MRTPWKTPTKPSSRTGRPSGRGSKPTGTTSDFTFAWPTQRATGPIKSARMGPSGARLDLVKLCDFHAHDRAGRDMTTLEMEFFHSAGSISKRGSESTERRQRPGWPRRRRRGAKRKREPAASGNCGGNDTSSSSSLATCLSGQGFFVVSHACRSPGSSAPLSTPLEPLWNLPMTG